MNKIRYFDREKMVWVRLLMPEPLKGRTGLRAAPSEMMHWDRYLGTYWPCANQYGEVCRADPGKKLHRSERMYFLHGVDHYTGRTEIFGLPEVLFRELEDRTKRAVERQSRQPDAPTTLIGMVSMIIERETPRYFAVSTMVGHPSPEQTEDRPDIGQALADAVDAVREFDAVRKSFKP